MENIRQEFLNEAVHDLEKLSRKLAEEIIAEEFLREIFRLFHTLKGTSQTLNFKVAGKLAHELENLLHAAQNRQIPLDENFILLLREGTAILCETLRRAGEIVSFPEDFAKKLRSIIPNYAATNTEDFLDDIPANIFDKLSVQERKSLVAALADGRNFYAAEVEFSLADFAEQFRQLREILQSEHEITATFPKTEVSAVDKIGFCVYFVSHADEAEISELVKPFGAKLTNFNQAANFTNDLRGVLNQTVSAGEKVARRLKKVIEFEAALENVSKVSDKRRRLISECLLHLVRNAADHAIEKSGKIKIDISSAIENLILRVSDDGRGLDAGKIRLRAIEKDLISADENLSIEETFKLIFAPGFSTADTISEISGRGVGLDVVQNAVKNAGGEIRVSSEKNGGTIFEIILPPER